MVCDLAAIQRTFRVGEDEAATVLRFVHRDMTAELMRRLAAGKITARNLGTQRRSKYRKAEKAQNRLRAVYDSIGRQGRQHVVAEMKKQNA